MNRRFSSEHIQWPPKKIPEGILENGKEGNGLPPISSFRVALPQILASTAKNLLLLDLGMTIAFATIVIPSLLKNQDAKGLTFTEDQASWFGSITYICQPLGSLISGVVLEPIGRKYAMMLVNIPHLLGWFLFYIGETKALIYTASVIMGLGIGFMEAPIITYVGEISQPRLRGFLTAYANLFATFGMVLTYFIGSLVDWRTAAAISMAVPTITVMAISQVPETPMWLLAHDRQEDAEKALCWLRGWVSPEYVQQELNELKRYTQSTKLKKNKLTGVINPGFISDDGTISQNNKMECEELSVSEKIKDFVRPSMLKPLGLIVGFFFFGHFTGTTATRPDMVRLAEQFSMPIDPYKATVVFGTTGFAGSVLCMLTVAKFKKRPIALMSLSMASVSAICLYFLPYPWLSFICYLALTFSTFYGAHGLVWALVSEVFPFRGRGTASGVAAASSYLISFLATKSYRSLKEALGWSRIFLFYGIVSSVGVVFLYFCMPETEGRSLEEIENDYGKKNAKNGSSDPRIV